MGGLEKIGLKENGKIDRGPLQEALHILRRRIRPVAFGENTIQDIKPGIITREDLILGAIDCFACHAGQTILTKEVILALLDENEQLVEGNSWIKHAVYSRLAQDLSIQVSGKY